jgi:hypothetical protein
MQSAPVPFFRVLPVTILFLGAVPLACQMMHRDRPVAASHEAEAGAEKAQSSAPELAPSQTSPGSKAPAGGPGSTPPAAAGEPEPVKGTTPSCDKPPEPSMCCQAMIPSCESCKARNARIQADWRRRCDKPAGK